jgi:hypothetical protein
MSDLLFTKSSSLHVAPIARFKYRTHQLHYISICRSNYLQSSLCLSLSGSLSLSVSPYLFMPISVYLYFMTLCVRLSVWLLSAIHVFICTGIHNKFHLSLERARKGLVWWEWLGSAWSKGNKY